MDNQIPQKRKRIPWYGIGMFFSTIAVIIMIFLFFLTNYFYLTHFPGNANEQNKLQQFQNNIEKQVRELAETVSSQNQAISELHQTQSQTEFNKDEWRVRGAEFMTKMANDKLQFENNIPQAITLLQNADGYLSGLTDDRLRPVRKALAADITALQAATEVDVVGIYMKLSAMNDQINQLPLPNKPQQTESEQTAPKENLPWWRRGLAQAGQALQKVVIIRYNQQDVLPFTTPEQQNFLLLNLHSQMENAIWGLLHQQQEIYKTSLEQAKKWIIQYGQSDSPITKSLITNLSQLEQMNVHPQAPTISASLQEFQGYFASLLPPPPLSH